MNAPTAPTTAPNRADGAEGSDYAPTAPTAPSPLGRGGVVGADADSAAGRNLQRELGAVPPRPGSRSWRARGVETKARLQEVTTYGGRKCPDLAASHSQNHLENHRKRNSVTQRRRSKTM